MRRFIFIIMLVFCILQAKGQTVFVGDNPKIACWTIGEKQEVFVVVHGGPGVAHDYLRPEFDRLSTMGQVIYYDQRGVGLSDKSNDYTWQAHVNDLEKVIHTLAPDKKVVLVGSSWGVHLTLLYSLRFQSQVKAIILTGATPWESLKIYSGGVSYDSMMIRLNKTKLKFDAIDAQSFDSIIQSNLKQENEGLINGTDSVFQKRLDLVDRDDRAQYETLRSLKDMPNIEALREIKVPVLIINGGEKCRIQDGAPQLKEILEHSTLYTLDESCHDPWYNETEAFFKICTNFISGL